MLTDKAIVNASIQTEAFEGKTIEDLFDLVAKAERRSRTVLVYSAPREKTALTDSQDERYPFLLGAA